MLAAAAHRRQAGSGPGPDRSGQGVGRVPVSDPFTTPQGDGRTVACMITNATPAVVGIVVADMARALAFYRLLGLDIPADADAEPHVEVALAGGLRLAFDTEETITSFHPAWNRGDEAGGEGSNAAVRHEAPASSPRPGTGGRVSLAFALPDAAAVDGAYAELTAAGHHGELTPFDAFWGMRYATVRDPDGTGVDLFASLHS